MGLAVLHQVRWQCLQPSVLTFGSVQRMRKSTLTKLAYQLFGQDVAAEPPTQCGHLRHFQCMRFLATLSGAAAGPPAFLLSGSFTAVAGEAAWAFTTWVCDERAGGLSCVRLCAKRHRVRRSLLACEKAK